MNLTWKSSKNCPKKTPESKADSAYLSPSSDYFWWFDGWSMHQYSQVLRVGVDVLRKKSGKHVKWKGRFLRKKQKLRPCGYQGSCVAELAVPNPPYIRGLELSGVLGWACMWKTIKNQVSLVQMQPHHPVISWPCDIVSWLPFPCLSLDSRRLFGISVIWCINFHVFWVYFHIFSTSCIILRGAMRQWCATKVTRLPEWVSCQVISPTEPGAEKPQKSLVQSYQMYANIVEKLYRSNQIAGS